MSLCKKHQPKWHRLFGAGSAGQLGGTQAGFPMNAMQFSDAIDGGALILEVQANRLDAKWICADGQIRDKFTMMKRVNTNTTININQGDMATLTASFVGNYTWSNAGETSRTITITPAAAGNFTYTVQDGYGCLADTFNVKVASTVLPVKLIDFNGILSTENEALLKWTSGSEINSNKYIVQTSVDAASFTNVAIIPSSNIATGSSYVYTHKSLKKGYNYFRLQMVDKDGSFTYSEIIPLFVGSSSQQIAAFPNPFKNNLTVTGAELGNKLLLIDGNGKQLLQQFVTGRGIDHINTGNFPVGSYVLKVVGANGEAKTLKVVKQ